MTPSAVYLAQTEWRAALNALDHVTMQRMARRWLRVHERLQDDIAALAREMARRRQTGGAITREMLWRERRYSELLMQIRREIVRFDRDAALPAIRSGTEKAVQLAFEHVQLELRPHVALSMTRLPAAQVENMAGRLLSRGAPLEDLLKQSWPAAVQGLTDSLLNGVALGYHPTKTARLMQEGIDKGFERIIVIARTEMLGAYRHTTLEGYRDSGLVRAYQRLCAKQERTCLACLLDDGHVYELMAEFADHVMGRCRPVAILIGRDELPFKKGRDWLLEQDEPTQRRIMGGARFEAWRDGAVRLEDMVVRRDDPVWGPSVSVASLRDLGIARPPMSAE